MLFRTHAHTAWPHTHTRRTPLLEEKQPAVKEALVLVNGADETFHAIRPAVALSKPDDTEAKISGMGDRTARTVAPGQALTS